MKETDMSSTTSNAMPEQPAEMPVVEPRPAQQESVENEHLVHPGAKLGWADSGGMVEQQASAMEWVRASAEASRDVAGEVERAAVQERPAVEMTDSRQAAQYSRWTGEALGETADLSQSAGIGQSH
jgi:hypothetical protein